MKPCLDCGQLSERSRCPTHHRQHNQQRDRAHTTRRRQAPGNGAARRTRDILNRHQQAICRACGLPHHPRNLEVDHITPLGAGGTDTDDNLQILCKPCHAAKTRNEARGTR